MVALLGHPVGHSISPQMHNAAFAELDLDVAYLAFDVVEDDVAVAVQAVRALGLLGANVTVPHKRRVWEQVDERTDEAQLVGAANTLFWDGDRLIADNTDAAGLERVLAEDVGLEAGQTAVLFGAGGAARAAAVALGRLHSSVEVIARQEEARRRIIEVAATTGATPVADVDAPRVVINATPLGLRGEGLPERLMRFAPGQVALDLVYGPRETPFLRAAREQGAQAVDGLGMLVGQAALAFHRWTGLQPPEPVMYAAARAALTG